MTRLHKRVIARENLKIHNEFWFVVNSFAKYVDDVVNPEYTKGIVFKKHNEIWMKFCNHWKTQNHLIDPDSFAFFKFVNGEIQTTTTTDRIGTGQKLTPNDKEKNGENIAPESGDKKTKG